MDSRFRGNDGEGLSLPVSSGLLFGLALLAFGLGGLLALLLRRLGRGGDDLEGGRVVLDA